jgi:hypothetical protein
VHKRRESRRRAYFETARSLASGLASATTLAVAIEAIVGAVSLGVG